MPTLKKPVLEQNGEGMPTQAASGALPLGSVEGAGGPSAMSVQEALARAKQNLRDTLSLSANGMSKAEALAVAWTGIEALARMREAKLYRSPKTGRVVIELLATELNEKGGLKPLAKKADAE